MSVGPARSEGGYTLIELMITVAIIAILARIAIPAYRDYVVRGQLIAGTNALLQTRTSMEQYYQDNRTYASSGTTCGATIPTAANFTITCTAATSSTYTVTATGTGNVNGWVYTIDQAGNQTTTSQNWGGSLNTNSFNCWLIKKGQTC